MMQTKAVESTDLDLSDMYLWDDSDLNNALINAGGKASELARAVMNRRLYKKALICYPEETSEELTSFLASNTEYNNRKKLEQEIADKAGVDMSDVILEMPSRTILLSKANIGKTDVSILDHDGKVRLLSRTSPIAKSLQVRDTFGWSVMVACPEAKLPQVEKAAKKILNL